jgi:hypothetical protein
LPASSPAPHADVLAPSSCLDINHQSTIRPCSPDHPAPSPSQPYACRWRDAHQLLLLWHLERANTSLQTLTARGRGAFARRWRRSTGCLSVCLSQASTCNCTLHDQRPIPIIHTACRMRCSHHNNNTPPSWTWQLHATSPALAHSLTSKTATTMPLLSPTTLGQSVSLSSPRRCMSTAH